jgi:hypothetical protein
MPLPAIGYVTTGKYEGSFKEQFLQGLASSAAAWQGDESKPNQNVAIMPGEANGAYDAKNGKQVLNRHVRRLSSLEDVKLIVGVGGLVSAFSVARNSDKPFLVLIGQVPATDDFDLPDVDDDPPKYCGGINLNNLVANVQRNAAAVAKVGGNCKPSDVCLIVNENSRMTRAERKDWKSQGWRALAGGTDADGDNDAADFKRVLRKAQSRLRAKAVVISSDSFFAQSRDELTSAANAADMVVCYPSEYFRGPNPAAPLPKAGRDIWLGPNLDAEYKKLGKKAGDLLTKIMSAGRPEFMGLDPAALTSGNF